MSVLKASHLTKQFGSFQALNRVSLELKKGEIYGFIGPNGAGKSTTIRILLGMIKASSGKAQLFGMDAWKDAVDIHKRLAYVPGDVNLWPNLTGGEVIDFFMRLHGNAHSQKREQLIERFQLDPTKKCRAYSKGNRQKVALVAAFASNADLFILDEPTSGLDPLMERVFQECVLEAKRDGKSVLLSSHILSEVERLCDKVGIIRQGQMIETGILQEMRHLTRTQLYIETKKPIEQMDQFEGIYELKQKEAGLSFQVDAEKLDEVMSYLSRYGIKKLESTAPTLEDLFMRHYEVGVEGVESR
ncbi:ABC transporter ATP-binding protein [Halalkalibacter sp. APA_J-10(15)]|uniref:ABC transporter ATP-binding protein n=1 Tax=Halalkalibacter sp. APA_J-10(15) TaxID=2933805 RepID=UPI001FF21F68|nr:ABC transporter ATP-binding protein [Halalkalibacter sp. APA_J-10(15)]MCK0472030.1 ABC transporter ATP-binding protein [Halalkalibacter sp. APA_J-10(15)]